MYDRKGMGMNAGFNELLKKEKQKIDKKLLKSYTQRMYKVGFGPNLWGIISEDSLDKYDYLEGCIEEHGTRTIYYVEQESEIHYLEEEE